LPRGFCATRAAFVGATRCALRGRDGAISASAGFTSAATRDGSGSWPSVPGTRARHPDRGAGSAARAAPRAAGQRVRRPDARTDDAHRLSFDARPLLDQRAQHRRRAGVEPIARQGGGAESGEPGLAIGGDDPLAGGNSMGLRGHEGSFEDKRRAMRRTLQSRGDRLELAH
jgi:hypothetical protein